MNAWKPKKLLGPLVLLALILATSVAPAGNQEMRRYVMFGGSNTDSNEQLTPWIPIRGAHRVILRTWSGKAAFDALTDADSTFSDTITVFRVGFTDSLQNTNPAIAGDSVIVTTATVTNVDTTAKMVGVSFPPLQEALRGPGNGSGIYTIVYPTAPGLTTAEPNATFGPQYMRVYVTPRRRMTVTGSQSTQGIRVNGLRRLRMEALVYWDNK